MEKVKLTELSGDDLHVISDATTYYATILKQLCLTDNTSQQHIHLSIIEALQYEVLARITKREQPKNNTLKMEVHTAFVLYDALEYYGHQVTSLLTSAIIRRIIMELFALLPFTRDHQKLSLVSNLNFNQE